MLEFYKLQTVKARLDNHVLSESHSALPEQSRSSTPKEEKNRL